MLSHVTLLLNDLTFNVRKVRTKLTFSVGTLFLSRLCSSLRKERTSSCLRTVWHRAAVWIFSSFPASMWTWQQWLMCPRTPEAPSTSTTTSRYSLSALASNETDIFQFVLVVVALHIALLVALTTLATNKLKRSSSYKHIVNTSLYFSFARAHVSLNHLSEL